MASRYIPNLSLLPQLKVSPYLSAELAQRAEEIAEVARQKAPVLTGALAASIESQPGVGEATVFSDLRYAGFVEFGTSDTPAQPFLRPAGDEVMG